MRDQILLLFAAVAASLGAWAFWHFLGDGAFFVLNAIVFIALIADNRRLRGRLRRYQSGRQPEA